MEKLDSKFERAERQATRQNLIIKGMACNPVNLVRGVEEFFEQKLETKVRVKKVVKLNRGPWGTTAIAKEMLWGASNRWMIKRVL